MEIHNNIERIIRLYFGKHISQRGQSLFGRWLRSSDEIEEKEKVLQRLWLQASTKVTDTTYEDWNILQKRIISKSPRKHSLSLPHQWLKYAAVVALMLLTAGSTYLLTMQTKPLQPSEMAELFVPYGKSREFTLPDGSQVWVNSGSLLVYPKDFSKMNTRTVYLSGEASFKVQHNKEQPFIVKTTHMNIEALGTHFTVESYQGGMYTKATLEEGSIRVDIKGEKMSSSILKPNDQLVYCRQNQSVSVLQVDAYLYGMERSGYLIFENTPLSQVIASLERKFNVTIHYNAQKYANAYYNIKLAPEESLTEVLDILQQLVGLKYKIKDDVVFIN